MRTVSRGQSAELALLSACCRKHVTMVAMFIMVVITMVTMFIVIIGELTVIIICMIIVLSDITISTASC